MQFGPCGHILQGGPDIRLVCRQHGCLSPLHALVAQDAPRPGKSNALCNRKMARRSTLPNVREGADSEVVASPSYVRFPPRSGGKADMPIPTLWATALNRCAITR